MKMKQIVACAAVLAASSVAAPAFAGATGNVGVFSDYVFRGITQTGGPAVQGGLDYSTDVGLYAGTWISNVDFGTAATYETDVYGGYAGKAGDFGYDVGAIYYYYRGDNPTNTVEYYAGGSFNIVSAKFYYTPNAFSSGDSAMYVTGSAAFPLSDSLTLTPQVGYSFGDYFDSTKEILDYSLTLAKALEGGFTFSFGLTGTDRDGTTDETLVVGLKKSFGL